MPQPLRDWLRGAAKGEERFLHARGASVALGDLVHGSSLGGDLAALDGACVLVLARDQLTAALTLIELDGVARRMILCPADFARERVGGERLGEQIDVRIEPAMVDDGIARIAGHVEYLDCGAAAANFLG